MIDYDPHHWRDHLFDIKGSMVRQICSRVLACVVWSAAVVYVHETYYPLDIPPTAHVLTGVVVGLLLVFRTNASYDRFWEGRKQWGGIVNESGRTQIYRGFMCSIKSLADDATIYVTTDSNATITGDGGVQTTCVYSKR